ncbi:hypothetical protein JCM18920_1059 [Cutibacterium acnes JCM 18920]|jgi:hypothetical protein|nr:hypothetical protein JCM18920_1059 [Cutibacterium acnes JCM 18920]
MGLALSAVVLTVTTEDLLGVVAGGPASGLDFDELGSAADAAFLGSPAAARVEGAP